MEDQKKILAKVVAKAWADEAYKKSLLANPKETLKNEGIDIPDGVKVNFVENTQDTINFVLPFPKKDVAVESEEDRKAASIGYPILCFGL